MQILEDLTKKDYKAVYEALPEKKVEQEYYDEYLGARDIREKQVGKLRQDRYTKSGKKVPRSKIAIEFQKKIVRSACSFLFAFPPEIQNAGDYEDALELFRYTWNKSRVDSLLMPFAEAVKSQTEAAIAFFKVAREGEEPKIKCRLLSRKNGNIHPVFDEYEDMKAFIWEYQDVNEDSINHIHIWTAEKYTLLKKEGDSYTEVVNEPNEFGKIPVVYVDQEFPEWWEVKDLIDSYENSFSKFVDTNGYFAAPMYKASGAVGSMPEQDQDGRMVKMDIIETDKGNVINADLSVLSWDRSPESLKMEFEKTYDLMHYLTDTPDLSFDNVKGIGNVAETTMRLMFMAPILKAKWSEPTYYTALERMGEIIKSGMVNITKETTNEKAMALEIQFTFRSALPQNLQEVVQSLVEATGGLPVMSQRTAVELNPMVPNANTEIEDMAKEQNDRARRELGLDNTNNEN